MSIPEPEFEISVYQLIKMLEDLGVDLNPIDNDKNKMRMKLKRKMFEYLDTVK
tara:strand:- start:5574 stop:5732 length:159 start_codon:yes stop_codon:yes gene_type:complete